MGEPATADDRDPLEPLTAEERRDVTARLVDRVHALAAVAGDHEAESSGPYRIDHPPTRPTRRRRSNDRALRIVDDLDDREKWWQK